MAKIFVIFLAVLTFVAIGWYSLPANIREKAMAFVGVARRGDRAEVQQFIAEAVLPVDPKERREVLIKELKTNIAEIKRRASVPGTFVENITPTAASSVKKTPENISMTKLVGATEKILSELEGANYDIPVSQKVVERILEVVLPSPARNEEVVCRIEKKQ